MHFMFGVIHVMAGHYLVNLYRALRWDFVGRLAIRRCCTAFSAGAGLDDVAVAEISRLGQDAMRLLQSEAAQSGEYSAANRILNVLQNFPQS